MTTSAENCSPTKLNGETGGSILAKSVEEINIYEFSYSSSNKKHFWKKREVALFLVGNFAEDISMYRIRNPQFDIKNLVSNILKTNFEKALLKTYLKGRTLWCASQLAEIIHKDYSEIINNILHLSKDTIIDE